MLIREAGREFRDQVQLNVRRAAESTNREFAIMYDISGLKSSSDLERLVDHWQTAVDSGVTSSPSYLQDGGKPVVAIWGFGFSDRLSDANAARELLLSFKTSDKYSAQLFGGVPKNWRTDTDQWKAVYALYDIISPWSVGGYHTGNIIFVLPVFAKFSKNENSDADIENWVRSRLRDDVRHCRTTGQKYFPVIWPGFTWGNLKARRGTVDLFNKIPRRGGAHLWSQVYNFFPEGVDGFYGAMFDEVDEGTAWYKVIPDMHHPMAVTNNDKKGCY